MINPKFLLLLLCLGCQVSGTEIDDERLVPAPEPSIQEGFQISSRVDTSSEEVRDVLDVYIGYMHSSPEFVRENLYWNAAEQKQFQDFDFSRQSLFQGLNSEQLLSVFQPFVMSVEPVGSKYQIRVMFSNPGIEQEYVGSKLWCIQKLNAVREAGGWKLENLLVEQTRSWSHKQLGFIDYVYPPEHEFQESQGQRALRFCNTVIERFNPSYDGGFQFYLTSSIDQMGLLENFDYYFTGITTGKAKEGMILSAKGSAFYPHEFVHKLLPLNANRGHAIEEGLATFLGTKEDVEAYMSDMKNLARDYNVQESFTLENILNNTTEWNGYPAAYPGGALICEVIHAQKGDAGLKQLITGSTNNYQEIIALMTTILGVDESQVVKLIEAELEGFK